MDIHFCYILGQHVSAFKNQNGIYNDIMMLKCSNSGIGSCASST